MIINHSYATNPGFTHRKLDYNNQDFALIHEEEDLFVALVADGCGSGSNSEVGSQLGLQFIKSFIKNNLDDWKNGLHQAVLEYSKNLALLHSSEEKDFVRNHLLYTVLGIVITENESVLFHCGDGVYIKDGSLTIIDQNNRPKYLNNELVGEEKSKIMFEKIEDTKLPILIASDGLEDFIEGIHKGHIWEFDDFEAFLDHKELYYNPIALPQLLQKYSRSGVLRDDTSVCLICTSI